jgi:hypothetical protein
MKKAIVGFAISAIVFGAPLMAFAMPCTDSLCYPMPIGTGTGNPGHGH